MISDWYQAIVDVQAKPEQTTELAIALTSALAKAGIITLYVSEGTQTHITGKFAPGPKFQELSGQSIKGMHHIGGMDVHTSPWVNDYGIIGLETASCPICGSEFSYDAFDHLAQLRASFGQAGQAFVHDHKNIPVACPICQAKVPAKDWITSPHLGFCHLAFTFWNWPPFEDWNINILPLVEAVIGHKPVLTYGRL